MNHASSSHLFQPGKSGNPEGRPKKKATPSITERTAALLAIANDVARAVEDNCARLAAVEGALRSVRRPNKIKHIHAGIEATRSKPLVCECCGRLPAGKLGIVFDHCHASNKFRGWLCSPCNSGIGMLGDNIDSVRSALEYLKKFEPITETP